MDNFLIDTVIEKVDGQGKRLDQNEKLVTEMKEKVSGISDQSDNFKKLGEVVGQILEKMNQIDWPVEKMNELSLRLKLNNDLLSKPVKTKTTVVHTAGKLGWGVLFLSCSAILLVIGLFEIAGKLDQYKMNDLLWRYVKVTNKAQNIEYLQAIESLYLKNPELMNSYVEQEELKQRQQLRLKAKDPSRSDSLPLRSKPKGTGQMNSILKNVHNAH